MTDPQCPDGEFRSSRRRRDARRMREDATALMWALAEVAGDDDATSAVTDRWMAALAPDYYARVCTGALTLMVRGVLGPALDAAEEAGLNLRTGIRSAAANSRTRDTPD